LECPSIAKDVVMIVVGRNGIIHHKYFDKINQHTMQVLLTTTSEMLPEAKIVFYATVKKQNYYGSKTMKFNVLSENFVSFFLKSKEI
jgi:hypothetical protein